MILSSTTKNKIKRLLHKSSFLPILGLFHCISACKFYHFFAYNAIYIEFAEVIQSYFVEVELEGWYMYAWLVCIFLLIRVVSQSIAKAFSKTAEMFASEIALLQISITSSLDNESKFFFEKRFANSANESTRS